MPAKRSSQSQPPTLRERAEGALRVSPPDIAGMSVDEIQKLVHDLQVHQIELKIQNEELQTAQAELAHSHDRFNDLYDFAPVGFLTIDKDGTIVEANLTAAKMLGVERKNLIGRWATKFVAPASQDALYRHQQAVFDGEEKRACDVVLRRADGTTFSARMESVGAQEPLTHARHCRSAIIDISERKLVEEKLADSEHRFRALTEKAAEDIILLDAGSRIIYESPHETPLLGFAPGEMTGHIGFELVHPDDQPFARQKLGEVLRVPGATLQGELRMRRKDGGWSWIHFFATNLLAEPAVGAVVLNLHDITERKEAEAALRESEQRYRTLFETMDEGFCVVEMLYAPDGKPQDYRFVEINPAFVKQTGLEQALGRTIRELVPEHEAYWFEIYGQVARTGEAVRFEHRATAMNRWFDVYAFRLGGPGSGRVAILFNDITERKEAEERLRSSAARLRQGVRVARLGLFEHDHRTDEIYYSPVLREICGWSATEPVTLPKITGAVLPEERAAFAAAVQRAHDPEGDGLFSTEHRLARPDGTIRWVSAQSQTTFEGEGESRRPVRTIGALVDITARKESEAALRDSEARLRLFIENAPAGIAIFDREMRYLAVSHRWIEDHRATGNLLGRSHYEVFPDVPERWKAVHRRGLAGEVIKADEDRFDRADGTTQWMRWEVHPWRTSTGEIGGIMIVAEEITERRRAKESLRNVLRHARAIIMHSTVTAPAGWERREWTAAECQWVGHFHDEEAAQSVLPVALAPGEAYVDGWGRAKHPDDVEPMSRVAGRALASGAPGWRQEFRALDKHGGLHWFMQAALIEPAGPGRWSVTTINTDITARKQAEQARQQAHDELELRVSERTAELLATNWQLTNEVTERKQAEAALRRSEERLRFALETSHIGAWDLDLVNHAAFRSLEHDRTFGYSELLPQWTYELFLEHVLPEDRAEVDARFQHAVKTHGDWNYECRIRRRDGEVRWIWATGRHLTSRTGVPHRMAGIVQDITGRKQAEAELRESEALFRQVTSAIDQAFWMTDLDKDQMLYVSPGYERIWGRSCQSLYDSPRMWLETIHPDDRARVLDAALTKQATGDYDLEYRIRRPDGEERWIHDRAFPIQDAAGRVHRIAGIADDITERKRLHDEIIAAGERERERIGQNLHDGLCQILTAARLKTDSLVTRLAGQEPASVRSAKSVASLIVQAVDEAQGLARGLEPVEPLPEGLMSALQGLAASTSRLFNAKCTCEFPRLVLVPDHKIATELFRIAQEATNNAIKHGHAANIRIRFADEAGAAVLSVVSDGKPFPKRQRSLGMGLKTMRFRAGRIGATIEIQRGPRKGTIVRCVLPAAFDTSAPAITATPPVRDSAPPRKEKGTTP